MAQRKASGKPTPQYTQVRISLDASRIIDEVAKAQGLYRIQAASRLIAAGKLWLDHIDPLGILPENFTWTRAR